MTQPTGAEALIKQAPEAAEWILAKLDGVKLLHNMDLPDLPVNVSMNEYRDQCRVLADVIRRALATPGDAPPASNAEDLKNMAVSFIADHNKPIEWRASRADTLYKFIDYLAARGALK